MFNNLINYFLLDKTTLKFIKLNKKLFKNFKNNNLKKNQILIEFNNWKPFHVSNSYILNYLLKKYNAEAIGYELYSPMLKKNNLFEKIKWIIGSKFLLKTFYVYSSFNVNKFITIKFSNNIKNLVRKNFKKVFSKIKKKSDLEKIEINKVWIGDLIYDSFLKKYNVATIDIESNNFKIFFKEFLHIFFFWYNYIKNNKVKSVLSSHGVYTFAIPLRIAVSLNIDSFVANEQKIYRYDKKCLSLKENLTGNFSESRLFKSIYSSSNKSNKKYMISKGKKISDQIAIKSKKLFYINNEKIKKLKLNNFNVPTKKNIRVLISSHAFTDSPHVFGNNLFVDFRHWFDFLNKTINETNYEWFLKPHPNKDECTTKEIGDLVKKNKRITLLDNNYNINHLSKLKIDFTLTIFGVVAREHPLRNINVISASANGPHSKFNFTHTCKNLKEYKNILLNLDSFKPKINNKQLYLYHYMNDIYFNRNYLFLNFDEVVTKIGGIKNFYNSFFYEGWIKYFKNRDHERILRYIKTFIDSKDYSLNLKHQINKEKNFKINY